MTEAEKELWKAMRQYIAEGLEQIKRENERLMTVRRELGESKRKQR